MKSTLSLLLGAIFLLAATFAPRPADDITVTGRLIDTKCYGMMPEANLHNTHKVPKMADGQMVMKDGMPVMMDMPNCATACSGMGIPAGIVEGGEAGGKTYVIIASANALKDHMDKEARITGSLVFEGGIIASKVEVKDGDYWKDVTPAAMM